MSFNAAIPVGTDQMLVSQPQIRANFQAINSAFSTNHVGFNYTMPVQGMHNTLTFREQSGDPVTIAGVIALYTKAVSGVPQIFFRPQSNATPIQMTYSSLSTGLQSTNPNVYLPTQYSFVAGPFVIYGGLILNATNGQIVTLSPSTNLQYVGLTVQTQTLPPYGVNGGTACASNISTNSFKINFQTSAAIMSKNIYYLAIGK